MDAMNMAGVSGPHAGPYLGRPGVHSSGRHRRAEPFAAADGGPWAAGNTAARDGRTAGHGFRARTVRAKVVALLMVPVVALMAMWGLAAVTVVGDALTVQQVSEIEKQVREPLDRTVAALQLERAAVVRFLGAPAANGSAQAAGTQTAGAQSAGAQTAAALGPSQTSTDAAITSVRAGLRAARVQIAALPTLQSGIGGATADFDGLAAVRSRVAARQIPAIDAYDAYTGTIEDLRAVDSSLAAVRAGHTASTGTLLAAALGLLAIFVSLLISVRIGRGLVGELVGLRNAALDLAGRRLPGAIARLRAGQEIDLAAEAPAPRAGAHGDDEVGQVAEALAVVQRAALEAAVERAEVVSGVAGVFLNLARRSQTLVHRQLALLESMERRVDDPAELEDLFRLDHLATRMRRHAEGLIILSGSPPGRGWRRPVPLMDVMRAAAAEVEDFARVDVRRMPLVAVSGGAVADLTHLVAELVENATAFSPPHSRVVVRGEPIEGGGCLIEVEDRGLGMGGPALADANRRIADARPDDLFESDRLGLYVVSRLARRHGIEVLLRPGVGTASGSTGPASRGTVAVVVVPGALVAGAGDGEAGADLETDGTQGSDSDAVEESADADAVRRSGSRVMAGVAAGGAGALGDPAGPRRDGDDRADRNGHAVRGGHADRGDHAVRGETGFAYGDRPSATSSAQSSAQSSAPTDQAAPADRRADHHAGHATAANPHTSEAWPGAATADPRYQPPRLVGENGLPRRIRQASLAAQLRTRDTTTQAPDTADGVAPSRSPDTVRATMSALQQGWTRGRGSAAQEDE